MKPLGPVYADPADPTGATPLLLPKVGTGQPVPLGTFDVRLDSAAFTTDPLSGVTPSAGKRYLSVIFTLKNPLLESERYSLSSFTPTLSDQDGEKTTYNQRMLKASRDEPSSGQLAGGEEVRVRYFFELPQGVQADTLTLRDASGRGYAFDVHTAR